MAVGTYTCLDIAILLKVKTLIRKQVILINHMKSSTSHSLIDEDPWNNVILGILVMFTYLTGILAYHWSLPVKREEIGWMSPIGTLEEFLRKSTHKGINNKTYSIHWNSTCKGILMNCVEE